MPLPSPVSPELVHATSTARHRLLVFRVCEDDPCSSDSYLQWLEGWPPEVVHTAPVPELGEGQAVTSARWVRNARRVSLVAVVDPRREGVDPHTLFLFPGSPGRYEIQR